jgi:hypothetical protein
MSAESQNCESNGEPLLGNNSANTPVAGQWLSIRHVIATDTHAAIEDLLKAVFSVLSMSRLYNEDQMP